jgi:thiamine biosynthesis protein ThiI
VKSAIVHYQEIALKGRNRPWFISRLVRNIREATSDLGIRDVRPLMGRIEVVLPDGADWNAVAGRLGRVFGAGNFARAGRAPLDVDAIAAEILRDLDPGLQPRSFRVSARRADKRFPL